MSTVRRCALPGCDVAIELEEGGQPRRYCCPEHRRASRFSRRVQEATKSSEPPVDYDAPAAERPSLFEPVALDLPPRARLSSSRAMLDVVPPPVNRAQGRRAANRRQRTIAVLASTAVFASAGWAASTQSPTVASPTPGVGAAMTPEQPVPKRTAAQWATEAQQTLDSVNHQLDLIAQAEEMWNRQPAALRSGPTPPAVQEMRSRGTVLGQQQALLQLQLDTYKSLDPANREVSAAEQKVADAQRVIPTDPQAANKPEARRLAEQRDLLARRLDAERQKQATVGAAVDKAVASPLPDLVDRTKPITDSVLGLVTDPLRRQPPTQPENKPPVAVPPREAPSRPRQDDVGKVAPPRPGPPSLGTGDAATPSAPTPTPADSAAAAPSLPSTPPSPNSQPAMTMLDSPGAAEPQPPSSHSTPTTSRATPDSGNNGNWSPSPAPRQNSSSWDLSQLSSPSGSSGGSNWSESEIRALMRDEPSGGDSRGGSSRDGGKHDGGKHHGGKHDGGNHSRH